MYQIYRSCHVPEVEYTSVIFLVSKIRGQRCAPVLMVDKTFNPNSIVVGCVLYITEENA
jgi:hypothetical protein